MALPPGGGPGEGPDPIGLIGEVITFDSITWVSSSVRNMQK